MQVNKTIITIAGVLRCCLASIAEDLNTVEVGFESACKFCQTRFRLVEDGKKFVWKPLWQIEGTAESIEHQAKLSGK